MRKRYDDMTVFVTGANRGLGSAFASALVERGAKKVYAAARDPETVRARDVIPVRLDVTDGRQVASLVQQLRDVTMLINNAGVHRCTSLFDDDVVDSVHSEEKRVDDSTSCGLRL